ncbi:hypothetical protein HETIRDRAFT_171939 [Heterobasidion irregulare TC 32-1]|uniref:Uncharacterized protein n=1 Tax=Heterobasidion irregulare (strain TC 32-1) TaxID=747525 RepID=W4K378_HETIT|nr:uncharacterized protein HETIRDRAFT_171939 [Heterobasidion irregulare TC 32-1]ETW79531.1 hypothetical protein HETIRDRAFT_171939 [Heterobasidion irregulare TC 32-1]
MSTSFDKVWFVTGASSGLGKQIVLAALRRGDRVIAAVQDISEVQDICSEACKALQLDVTALPDVLKEKARQALSIFGIVDIVVNNAAIALLGSVEELGGEGFLAEYRTNVFGVINVTNAFLPFMREKQGGTIVVIGSRSAWQAGVPMIRPYSSSKAAIHSVAETWSAELAPFKIKVLLVEPGSLRTSSLKRVIATAVQYGAPAIPSYAPFHAEGVKLIHELDGTQPGDPGKAAEVIVDVVRDEGSARGKPWPTLLALGEDAVTVIKKRCQAVIKAMNDWADVSGIEYEKSSL